MSGRRISALRHLTGTENWGSYCVALPCDNSTPCSPRTGAAGQLQLGSSCIIRRNVLQSSVAEGEVALAAGLGIRCR
jgi:hypothetical protein